MTMVNWNRFHRSRSGSQFSSCSRFYGCALNDNSNSSAIWWTATTPNVSDVFTSGARRNRTPSSSSVHSCNLFIKEHFHDFVPRILDLMILFILPILSQLMLYAAVVMKLWSSQVSPPEYTQWSCSARHAVHAGPSLMRAQTNPVWREGRESLHTGPLQPYYATEYMNAEVNSLTPPCWRYTPHEQN